MQKIMFSERYRLTDAVLKRRKTKTRRIVKDGTPLGNFEETLKKSKYKIGEIVAIAQSYHDAGYPPVECFLGLHRRRCDEAGWNNKMFVKAEEMRHFIKITDIHVERLQEISDEDCLKEGIIKNERGYPDVYYFFDNKQSLWNGFPSARDAFAVLIDKVSGKGTWEKNPFCFCYEFKLIK